MTRAAAIQAATASADSPAEVLLRLDLRPGRYNIRVGAEPADGGPAGSVFTSVVVPDFVKERLSLSGVAMGWAEGRPIGGREVFAAILPFAPTVVREFAASDHVGALVRLHQPANRPIPVQLETRIIDSADNVMASQSTTMPASSFGEGRNAEHRYELPLRALSPGEYLLRFVAEAAGTRVTREVRFSIR